MIFNDSDSVYTYTYEAERNVSGRYFNLHISDHYLGFTICIFTFNYIYKTYTVHGAWLHKSLTLNTIAILHNCSMKIE